jgi:hypothetical protein
MKNFLLLVVIIIAAVYVYNRYAEQKAAEVAAAKAAEVTPAPVQRRTTFTPRPGPLSITGLQTHSLNGGSSGNATPERRSGR